MLMRIILVLNVFRLQFINSTDRYNIISPSRKDPETKSHLGCVLGLSIIFLTDFSWVFQLLKKYFIYYFFIFSLLFLFLNSTLLLFTEKSYIDKCPLLLDVKLWEVLPLLLVSQQLELPLFLSSTSLHALSLPLGNCGDLLPRDFPFSIQPF